MSWQSALTAQKGCIKTSMAAGRPFCSSALLSWGSTWSTAYRSVAVNLLETVQRRAIKIIRVIEHTSCEKRPRELRLFIPESKRLQGDLTEVLKCVKRFYKNDGNKLFSNTRCNMRSYNVFKQKDGRLDRI